MNLVCYRSEAWCCDLQQLQCIRRTGFSSDEDFDSAVKANFHLIQTDDQFFQEIRHLYTTKLCGFFWRSFSLETLRGF